MLDDFRTRVNARLLLLPRHDPQFRRNRERVNRDAERELIRLDWDLGDEPGPTEAARAAAAQTVVDAPVVDAPAAEEVPAAEALSADDAAADETPGNDDVASDEASTDD